MIFKNHSKQFICIKYNNFIIGVNYFNLELSLPFPVHNRGFGLKFSLNFFIYHNGLFTPNFFYNRGRRLISHKSHKNQCEERFQRDQKCQ